MGEKDAGQRIAAAREGREGAADELFEGYRNYLRFLARDGVGGALRPKVDASDVVQDVLIRARDRFAQFRGETEPQLLGWLRQILARRIVDLARQHKVGGGRGVIQEHSLEEVLYESSQTFGRLLELSGTSASQHAVRREDAAQVADALARLDPDQQEVITLRTMKDMRWSDVAAQMGRSEGAVQMLWFRALKKLRPLLEGTT